MLERMYGTQDIQERYGVCRQTAVKRMKEMDTMLKTKPYMVPESAVLRWEKRQHVHPPEMVRAAMRAAKRGETFCI